jgi:enoyl-CoA hydratase/carnithine racemase
MSAPAAEIQALQHVRVSLEDEIALILLNRPEASNSLTLALLRELAAALDALAADERLRAVVITGAGRAFSTGGDVETMHAVLERGSDVALAESEALISALADVILRLRGLASATIAAINGHAAGAGFSLALACDIRIASERAALNFAYGALGTSPDGGMTWLLPRIVSPARATELLIEQPVLRANRALQEGLVSDIVPANELLEAARKRARRLAAKAPHSVRTARPLIEAGTSSSLEDQLARERSEFAVAVCTEDFRNGVAATLSGRRPDFHGH